MANNGIKSALDQIVGRLLDDIGVHDCSRQSTAEMCKDTIAEFPDMPLEEVKLLANY